MNILFLVYSKKIIPVYWSTN